MKKLLGTIFAGAMALTMASSARAMEVKDMNAQINALVQFRQNWSQITGMDDQLDVNRLRIKLSAQPAEAIKVYVAIEGTKNTSPAAAGSNLEHAHGRSNLRGARHG